MTWKEMAAHALRSAGPSRSDKMAALKRAGEEYRAGKKGHRSNPSGLVKMLLVGGAVVVGLKALAPKPAAVAAVPQQEPWNWPFRGVNRQ